MPMLMLMQMQFALGCGGVGWRPWSRLLAVFMFRNLAG